MKRNTRIAIVISVLCTCMGIIGIAYAKQVSNAPKLVTHDVTIRAQSETAPTIVLEPTVVVVRKECVGDLTGSCMKSLPGSSHHPSRMDVNNWVVDEE
jgi:hypothetical protein